MTVALTFETREGAISVVPDILVFAGFASRDPAAAEHHRRELQAKGVVVPDKVPVCYRGLVTTLSQAPVVETGGRPLMGEVEFVVLDTPAGMLIAPGVDLFDELIEQTDIEGSKSVAATPIARQAVRLSDVRGDWDSFRLWMRCDGRIVQEGSVGAMMEPEKLLALAASVDRPAGGVGVVYSGSMPYIELPKAGFEVVELGLEGVGTSLRHSFRLRRA